MLGSFDRMRSGSWVGEEIPDPSIIFQINWLKGANSTKGFYELEDLFFDFKERENNHVNSSYS